MTRQGFAKTWWGKNWIETLRHTGFSSRLPRGKSYATEGAVREVNIKDGTVTALVQAWRKTAYSITIRLEPFSPAEKKTIKKLITANPALATELCMGSLPDALISTLRQQNISLFPASWKAVNANCSCLDWANPCKHLVAVFLILSGKVDKDPLILFELRGVSRQELVVAAGPKKIPTAKDHFIPIAEVALQKTTDPDLTLTSLAERQSELNTVFSMLNDSPLFYKQENFKTVLLNGYKAVAKSAAKKMNLSKDHLPDIQNTHITLIYGPKGHPLMNTQAFFYPEDTLHQDMAAKNATYEVPVPQNNNLTIKPISGKVTTAKSLLDMMLCQNLIMAGTPEIRFLSAAASTALILAKLSLFIPEAVPLARGNFYIRYRPLIKDEHVQEVITTLAAMMPPSLIYRKTDQTVLSGQEGVEEVLSLYLSFLVQEYAQMFWDDKISAAFSCHAPYEAQSFTEQQTIKAVADWLAPLAMASSRFSPVIRVEPPTGKQKEFRLWLDVEDRNDPLATPIPLAQILSAKTAFGSPTSDVLADISTIVTIAGRYRTELKDLFAADGGPITLTGDELLTFLNSAKSSQLPGLSIILPKELRTAASARLVLTAKTRKKTVSYLSLAEMLDFSLDVALGDERLSKEEFIALAQNAHGIVRWRDRYFMLDAADVKRILTQLDKPLPKMNSFKVLRAGLTGEAGEAIFEADHTLKNLLANLHTIEEPPQPKDLKANLRPYQQRGWRWLYTNHHRGLGSCLADDMGLGKTLQVITLLLKLKEENALQKPALVVCPTTLLGNWEKECARFAPTLKTTVCHGPARKLITDDTDLVITSYGVLRNDKKTFAKLNWPLLIIDEAQNIKNADTAQARAIKEITAQGHIALSGTPVENRLDELWSIFDFLLPGFLGSRDAFSRRFSIPIEKYHDAEKVATLRKATSPFILRRMKTDKNVIADLPDKIIKPQYCHLTTQQAALYQQIVEREMSAVSESSGMERRGRILALMTSLKQICNHPVHFSKNGAPYPQNSGKAQLAFQLLRQILQDGEKALIFTQYKQMGDILIRMLEAELNQPLPFFHGSLTPKQREQRIEEFQNNPHTPLMVVSLKAGGTGLNLTAATHVLHYDLWWNPAVEDQATDRAYRIGQTKNVTVHRFITLGTLEEKIDTILTAKKDLADLTISAGETWLTEMSDTDLKELFSLSKT
ncbi:SNF2-related protein [Dethiobacter alkaliphilus]|uniref:Non-specific serine/threonine protein kinase n=1 Tax=Dethiobacter alkaliphilus AHT 1 TaxID=555088 RepID=C0GD07_DETAL|nr:SNF2-related protein [Dethiobacter alkaliphilus]EEG79092.1 Non-specific serine/threonine protein kinase [Dethiobacter alkaliphilus AHT 1]